MSLQFHLLSQYFIFHPTIQTKFLISTSPFFIWFLFCPTFSFFIPNFHFLSRPIFFFKFHLFVITWPQFFCPQFFVPYNFILCPNNFMYLICCPKISFSSPNINFCLNPIGIGFGIILTPGFW